MISSRYPATIGLNIAAIIPKLPEMPTNEPVYFGPRSAWLTPKPPAPIPLQKFIRHSKINTLIKESCNEIRYKRIAAPKKPMELTVFLTRITS